MHRRQRPLHRREMTSLPNNSVRIFVVEPQEISRTGFRLIFQTDQRFQIIGESNNFSASFAQINELNPDLLMLKITDENNDLVLLNRMKDSCPSIQIMAFFDAIDADLICRFSSAEVNGFCMSTVNVEHLLHGILAVASGAMWFSPATPSNLIRIICADHKVTKTSSNREINLSDRELEILKRLVKGNTNQSIAVELGLSMETVKTYIRRIMDKSSIRSRKQLLSLYRKLKSSNQTS